MQRRHLVDVAIALAFTPACGTEQASAYADPSLPAAAHMQALEAAAEADEEEVKVGEDIIKRVSRAYGRLKTGSALAEENWRFNDKLPQQQQFARVKLEDDADRGIFDGYAKYAMVALDADGAAPHAYYVMREGGIGGWQFLVGPFDIDPVTLLLNERHAGQTVAVKKGDRVMMEVLANPNAGHLWQVESSLGKAYEQYIPNRTLPGGRLRLMWDTHNQVLHAGDVYTLRFTSLHRDRFGQTKATRSFLVHIQVH